METKTLLLIGGAGILGIGALLASRSAETATPDTASGCSPSPSNCKVSPLMRSPPTSSVNPAVIALARTAWGEARGEGANGMQAVLNVIMNRARAGNFPGGTNPASVATARNQFSAWNSNDPNRAQLLAVTATNPQYRTALSLAQRAIDGTLEDLTRGAVYYHEANIPTPQPPKWPKVAETTQIGNHIFYVMG